MQVSRYPLSAEMSRVIARLRDGGAVILHDDEGEREGDLAFAAGHCTRELVNLCLHSGRGLLCIALRPGNAERIGVQRLARRQGARADTPFGMPIDLAGLKHAASASGRSATIRAAADGRLDCSHFAVPGHLATLIGHPLGLEGRIGHTECILDLLAIAGLDGPGVLCEILAEDGEVAGADELFRLSAKLGLPVVRVAEVRKLMLEERKFIRAGVGA